MTSSTNNLNIIIKRVFRLTLKLKIKMYRCEQLKNNIIK